MQAGTGYRLDPAEQVGVRAETVNSTNVRDWSEVEQRLQKDEIDTLIVSPELKPCGTAVVTVRNAANTSVWLRSGGIMNSNRRSAP